MTSVCPRSISLSHNNIITCKIYILPGNPLVSLLWPWEWGHYSLALKPHSPPRWLRSIVINLTGRRGQRDLPTGSAQRCPAISISHGVWINSFFSTSRRSVWMSPLSHALKSCSFVVDIASSSSTVRIIKSDDCCQHYVIVVQSEH